MIKCWNEIKLDNKLTLPYSIKTIKKKFAYMIFEVIFKEGKNRQFRRKVNLFVYKVLELKLVSFWKNLLGSFKENDLKLFNKFVFKDIVL